MFNDNASPIILNCIFSNNQVVSNPALGGAICNVNNSNPYIKCCTLKNNFSIRGGAIYNNGSNPTV